MNRWLATFHRSTANAWLALDGTAAQRCTSAFHQYGRYPHVARRICFVGYTHTPLVGPGWILCGSACTDLRAVFRHVVLREDVRPAWKWFAHVRTAAAMSPCHTRVTRMLPVLVSRALLPLSGAARAGRGSRLVHCQPGTPHCVLSQGCTHSRVGIHVVWYDGYPPCWWWQSPEAREQLANPKLPVTLCVTDPFLTPKGAQKLQWITLTTENTAASGGQDKVPHTPRVCHSNHHKMVASRCVGCAMCQVTASIQDEVALWKKCVPHLRVASCVQQDPADALSQVGSGSAGNPKLRGID